MSHSHLVTMPPRNDSFTKGSDAGRIAIETGMDYLPAYSIAVADSLQYSNPISYIRGFVQTYRAEEEKILVA